MESTSSHFHVQVYRVNAAILSPFRSEASLLSTRPQIGRESQLTSTVGMAITVMLMSSLAHSGPPSQPPYAPNLMGCTAESSLFDRKL